jgi:hypothetical protein
VEPVTAELVRFEPLHVKDLIAKLREKIAQAERGEIASFVFVATHVDGGVEHDYVMAEGESVYKLLGIVEMFKQRLASKIENCT